ncbi:MAG: hypothetical protein COB76_01095 [Alphaproteobacteria bacterium]|nr:MAG: hypothetical protein COB76_01095 [Alphaproteobacteria bacterium]
MNQVVLNRHVSDIAASAAVYCVDVSSKSFVYDSHDFALVYGGSGFLKKDFQAVHGGKADIDTQNRFFDAYNLSKDVFQASMRTVGVGTNILIRDGVGTTGDLHIPMVGRTATGPDGTPALGKQSRAAGGADGCLAKSGYRELQEEFICGRDENGRLTIFDLDYDEDGGILSRVDKEKILKQKRQDMARILQTYGLNDQHVKFETLKGRVLNVPGLTTNITQNIDGLVSTVSNRVLTDNPQAGDFAGVDTIVYAQLPDGMQASQLIVRDGETNFDGDLLKREWTLASAEQWIEKVADGMPISPAPKKVFENWNKVAPVIRSYSR